MKFSNALHALTYGLFQNRSPQYQVPTSANSFGYGGRHFTGELDAMGSTGTLYSIIRLLSTSTAQVDWHLYRKSVDGRRVYGPAEDNRTEVTRHLALNIFNKPNPLMTRMELIERTQQFLDLAGESFWVVEKTARGNFPLEIWPVRPDRMVEAVNKEGLAGWVYRNPDGTDVPFQLDEVVHIKLPNPTSMYRGMGPIQALQTDLESVVAAGEYNRNFFRNSAQPGGIIEVPESLDDKTFNRLMLQWGENHRGVTNAHRVGIMENGMKFQALSPTMRDMQFVDLRNMSRELIREAYGVHPHMLGISDTVNLANAYAADATFAKRLIQPRLERIKQALNSVFLPMFGGTSDNVEFCYEDPTPEDRESENAERQSKVNALVALVNAGADPAVACEAMGLPDIPFEKQEPTYPTLPQAPVSSVPEPPSQGEEEASEQDDVDAKTVARLLKEVFG